jgi:tetratricopeptide (TPR) repeat protein
MARHRLQSALEFARAADVVSAQHNVLSCLAELDLLEGEPHTALARLAPLADGNLGWGYAVPLLSALARAYLATGEVARAEQVAQRAVARSEQMGTSFYGVSALWSQGMVHARLARYDAADAAYGEALRHARAMPFPYGEAQLLHASGLLERQRGNDVRADERLREALAIFERLGAARDIERIGAAIEEKRPK